MFEYYYTQRLKKYAALHFKHYRRVYELYSKRDYKNAIAYGEIWLTSYPNYRVRKNSTDEFYSRDSVDLTSKPSIYFSNTTYFCMAICANLIGDEYKCLHYRYCMSEAVDFSKYCYAGPALSWRLLNLSIVRDADRLCLSQFSEKLRKVDDEDLASAGASGAKYWFQLPKVTIDFESGSIRAICQSNEFGKSTTHHENFLVEKGIYKMFEEISNWLSLQTPDCKWAVNPYESGKLKVLKRIEINN